MIKKYGYSKAIYIQYENGTGWRGEQTEVTHNDIEIIVLPSEKYSRETYRFQNEKDLPDSNCVAYIANIKFVPSINDKFIINGTTYTILSVDQICPDGHIQVLFRLEVK